jgi:hypothetical protein
MTRRWILPLALAASCGAGVASAGTAGHPGRSVGVIVDTTKGFDRAAVRAAQADVARLRASGVGAELRVTRSPSQTVAAAATLVTRGAHTLVTRNVARSELRPLAADVRVVAR